MADVQFVGGSSSAYAREDEVVATPRAALGFPLASENVSTGAHTAAGAPFCTSQPGAWPAARISPEAPTAMGTMALVPGPPK